MSMIPRAAQHSYNGVMSYLEKARTRNKAEFVKVQQFLQLKGIDVNNLPQQPARLQPQPQAQGEDSNSDFDITQYFRNRREHQPNQQQNTASNIVPQSNSTRPPTPSSAFPSATINKYLDLLEDSPDEEQQAQQANHIPWEPSAREETFQLEEYSYQPTLKEQLQNKKSNPLSKPRKSYVEPQQRVVVRRQDRVSMEQLFASKGESIKTNYQRANDAEWDASCPEENYSLRQVLKRFPHVKQFKNNQRAIIKCGLKGHDIFVCMPTGGGKSLTFQVLTFLRPGIYLCVLPLVSLIFDQEAQANSFGIEAYSLTAQTLPADIRSVFMRMSYYRQGEKSLVVFCTPEKFNLSQQFTQVLQTVYGRGLLRRVVIDQVHCVSTWGKQFRIEYENLSSIRKRYPKTPILALTATVTEPVKQDIITRLNIENCYFFLSSFNRPNLDYSVRPKDKNIFNHIQALFQQHRNSCGLIYCLARKDCEQISAKLNQRGWKTAYYHGDLREDEKKRVQEDWMQGRTLVIVATIAFGMGINKPNVRFVIHHTLSRSLENYYQQSGRAGRDGQPAQCILFYRRSDKLSLQSMTFRNDFSTLANKQFTTRQLAQMVKYCEERSLCRRKMQLSYLGEINFDPENCHRTCDNCRAALATDERECIDQGKLLLKTLISIEQARISISQTQLVSLLRKSSNKALKAKLPALQRAGVDLQMLENVFGHWKQEQIQALLLQFLSWDVLTEKIVQNQVFKNKVENSVINVYLKCNISRCQTFVQKANSLPLRMPIIKKKATHANSPQKNDQISHIDDGEPQQSCSEDDNTVGDLLSEEEIAQKRAKYRDLLHAIFEDDDKEP